MHRLHPLRDRSPDRAGVSRRRLLSVLLAAQLMVILDERGADERFVAWLGFVEALRRLHLREPSTDRPEEERTRWHT